MIHRHRDRILGGLWGSLVGDALGVPVEFRQRAMLDAEPVSGMRAFGMHHQPAGTWSDDSSMLLCTVDSLCRGAYDPEDLARRFLGWFQRAEWTPHGEVFDIGITTRAALRRFEAGTPPEEAGGMGEMDNGNGSLMRILPFALARAAENQDELFQTAMRASCLTHGHKRSQLACAYYCLLARELLKGIPAPDAWRTTNARFAAKLAMPPFYAEAETFAPLLHPDLLHRPRDRVASGGYVMDTLIASVWCLLTCRDFPSTTLRAVNLGGDTDTTGCVAGGLAGIVYGASAIPSGWLQVLARKAEVGALFDRFLATQMVDGS